MGNDKVAQPSLEHQALAQVRELVSDVRGGTATMRVAGKRHLPKEAAEDDQDYKIRLDKAVLFNGYSKSLKMLTGKPFSRELKIAEGEGKIEEWSSNIDLSGTDLHTFAKETFETAMADGVSFLVVDFPVSEGGEERSLDDEREMAIRPYISRIDCRNVIGWKSKFENGRQVLTQVRIAESVLEPDPENEFEDKRIEQIRVFDIGKIRLFRKNKKDGDWELFNEFPLEVNGNALTEIPIVPVYGVKKGFFVGRPVLEDMLHLNVKHWQSSSDQQTILHIGRMVWWYGSGMGNDSDEFTIGSNRILVGPTNSTVTLMEPRGTAIESGRKDIEDIENQMRAMGFEPLLKKREVTATEARQDQEGQDCELAALAMGLKRSLTEAFRFMFIWEGEERDSESLQDSISIHTEFGVSASDSDQLEHIYRARLNREISQERYLGELRRRGVLSDDIDIDEEIAAVEAEAPKPGETAFGVVGDGEEEGTTADAE